MAEDQQLQSELKGFLEASINHPISFKGRLLYGTAGFRDRAEVLDSVVFRVGLVAVLRSKSCHGETIGVMLTASHNPEADNGVKIIDPLGEMLEGSWEKGIDKLVNAPNTAEGLLAAVKEMVDQHKIDWGQKANVILARDTRKSGPALLASVIDGITSAGGIYVDHGMLTTPQLHYIVRCINTNGAYGHPSEDGYYEKISKAFSLFTDSKEIPDLVVDCANGIGAMKLATLSRHLANGNFLKVTNDGSSGILNEKCGADFVKVNQRFPEGIEGKPGIRCASLDGDADRLLYYYMNAESKFCLLDGDKISTLFGAYLKELLQESGLDLKLGVVQTAYANGSSTSFLRETMRVPVDFANTGVKYLHPLAQKYDIGVYFEANGHGTVLLSDRALELINSQDKQNKAAAKMVAFTNLINQAVGDAIADLLVVEGILLNKKWSLETWNASYTDLPNRLMKVKVKDRTIFETTDAERTLVRPLGLQGDIDKLVATFQKARSFVRPSGTEDVVRVYAEAQTQEMADELAHLVSLVVFDQAQGVGERPQKS